MSEELYSGKPITFLELVENFHIEIPIIQRDYAQGRIDKEEIREKFLTALYTALLDNKAIRLDFIYGSKQNNTFQPLDGQQRLTTLFLLHWYAAVRIESNNSTELEVLKKFTYETRISSREFCSDLVNSSIRVSSKDYIISNDVINSNWFFLSWKSDPTIDSMLRTIDHIHSIFYEIDDLWGKLRNSDIISFYFVELENIGLTDDLYIKMNARGKLLTDFENFKAGFQKHIIYNDYEKEVSFLDTFINKIDTVWTDFFWTNFKRNFSIDNAFMRFISTVAMIRIVLERSNYNTDDRNKLVQRLQDNPNSVKPDFFSKESFHFLYDCFQVYNSIYEKEIDLSLSFPLWRHEPKTTMLAEVVFQEGDYSKSAIQTTTYSVKVLFYAQILYLLKVKDFERRYYLDWMRVVRNLVSRGDIDRDGKRPDLIRSPQSFDGVINLINELSEGCHNIYNHLATIESIKSTYSKEQIDEERTKAKQIKNKPSLKELIFKSEDNELLRGRISFMLYCIDFVNSNDTIDETKLSQVQMVFEKYFNEEKEVSADLRRAMLTISVDGEYNFYNYWWSFWYVADANKRRLFDKYREIEYFIYSDFRAYFKRLVLLLCSKTFREIIDDFEPPQNMPNWKIRLIKEEKLLKEVSSSNYIAISKDDSYCYLLKSKRPRDTEGCLKIE